MANRLYGPVRHHGLPALRQGQRLAGLTTGLRVESILFLPAVAFSMTASVLVGHALGEGNHREAKRTLLATLGIACAGIAAWGAAIWPWRMELAGLIAPDPAVQVETVKYLSFNIMAVPFTVASVVLAGGLNGAGATVYPMVSFSFAVWAVRLPIAWLFGHIIWQDASGGLPLHLRFAGGHVAFALMGHAALQLDPFRPGRASPTCASR